MSQSTAPSLLKKAGKAPTHALCCRKSGLLAEIRPHEDPPDAHGVVSISHWHMGKENLANSRQSPVTGWLSQSPTNCQLPFPLSLTCALPAEMPLSHIFIITSFLCILLVCSLNTTLIKCTGGINQHEANSGHVDDVRLLLLGNKTPPKTTSSAAGNCLTYLFLEDTMENEYKHSLQRIEYGEEVRHDDCAFINIHESKCPGQS